MFRKIFLSLLTAILAIFHINFLIQNTTAIWIGFLLVSGVMIYKSYKLEIKEAVKHFQYKTLSILSFLLPVSAALYAFVFTSKAVTSSSNEFEQAGSALGGMIGGGILIFFTFLIGMSLGITFFLMSRKKA